MSTKVYAMSNGSYDDYRIHRFIRGPVDADFDALFNEFCAEFHRITPPYAVPVPDAPLEYWAKDYDQQQEAFNKAYDEWRGDNYDHEQGRKRTWNERGYMGDDKDEIFVSWLIEDKGFKLIEYCEIHTDSLYDDERYLRPVSE